MGDGSGDLSAAVARVGIGCATCAARAAAIDRAARGDDRATVEHRGAELVLDAEIALRAEYEPVFREPTDGARTGLCEACGRRWTFRRGDGHRAAQVRVGLFAEAAPTGGESTVRPAEPRGPAAANAASVMTPADPPAQLLDLQSLDWLNGPSGGRRGRAPQRAPRAERRSVAAPDRTVITPPADRRPVAELRAIVAAKTEGRVRLWLSSTMGFVARGEGRRLGTEGLPLEAMLDGWGAPPDEPLIVHFTCPGGWANQYVDVGETGEPQPGAPALRCLARADAVSRWSSTRMIDRWGGDYLVQHHFGAEFARGELPTPYELFVDVFDVVWPRGRRALWWSRKMSAGGGLVAPEGGDA